MVATQFSVMSHSVPYILYALSKDRTTQRLNRKELDGILGDLEAFLRTCTTTTLAEPDAVKITAYGPYDPKDPAELLQTLIKRTEDRFGARTPMPLTYSAHSGQPGAGSKYVWELGSEQLPEVLQHFRELGPLPRSSFGPLELMVSYVFKLVDPRTGQELPEQPHRSDLLLWFSRTAACAPTLYFPFQAAAQPFWSFVDAITPHLPFTLEEKYLKIAHINKQGQVSSFKKIVRPA